ncbi:MAG: ankyrin repeat domain-containing protein [Rickettsiaceae bacterium]|nr:ankyrin repeat domain-containing protein [Rickettsiaceae bacterium]
MSKFIAKNLEYIEILRTKIVSAPELRDTLQNALYNTESTTRLLNNKQIISIIDFIEKAANNVGQADQGGITARFIALTRGLERSLAGYITHIVISEYFNKFTINQRFAIEELLVANNFTRSILNYENPATETRIADMLLATATRALTESDNPHKIIIFNEILKSCGNVNLKNEDGETALSIAVKQNIPSLVNDLFNAGASLKDINSPLAFPLIKNILSKVILLKKSDLPQIIDEIYIANGLQMPASASSDLQGAFVSLLNSGKLITHPRESDGYSLNNENILKILKMLVIYGFNINNTKDSAFTTSLTFDKEINSNQIIKNTWLTERIMQLNGFDINTLNPIGQPYSFFALKSDIDIALKVLAMPNFDHTIVDDFGNGILHICAIVLENVEDVKKIVPKLLEKGCDINLQNNSGKTPVFVAIENNNPDIALYMAELYEPNLIIDSIGNTLLHVVSLIGIDAIDKTLPRLIKKGYDINLKNNQNDSPMSIALLHKKIDESLRLIELFESNDTADNFRKVFEDKNAEGNTLLHISAILSVEEAKKIVPKLLEKGCDINALNNENLSPILLALKVGNFDISLYLATLCDPDATVDNDGSTLMHISVLLNETEKAKEIIPKLLEMGYDINAQNLYGDSPFFLAVMNGKLELARYLIDECGADAKIKKHDGTSAAHFAAALGNMEMLELLNKHNVPLNEPISYINTATPFQLALSNDHKAVATFLANTLGIDNLLSDGGVSSEIADQLMTLGMNTEGHSEIQ